MCRNNVNNSYPLASPKMLSAFQILAKKVPSSPRVWGLRGIQNNPRGGKYLDKLHLGGRHLSNDKFQYFIRIFGPNEAHENITEPKRVENLENSCKKFASIRFVCFRSALFFFAILNGTSSIFFFQIQELIVKTTPPPPPPPKFYYFSNAFYIYENTMQILFSLSAWEENRPSIDHLSPI